MKKILIYVCAVCLALFAIVSGMPAKTSNAASNVPIKTKAEFETTITTVLNKYATFKNRVAGTAGEAEAGDYILEYLRTNTLLVPKDGGSVKEGVQSFQFESRFEGGYRTSRNFVFVYESASSNGQKVIIGSHYDAVAYDTDPNSENYGDLIESESIVGSAGNVALMMALANYLPELDLPFDIEFVFFGANESNYAGSKYYTEGISAKEKENILCVFNLDDIALGAKTYFYVNEVPTKMASLLTEIAETSQTSVEHVNTVHLAKSTYDGDELGLGYSHIALNSDNLSFMKQGILTVNMFAGDYSSGIVLGRNEFTAHDSINYTKNDNLAYITENYEKGVLTNTLYKAYRMLFFTLTDTDFVKTCEGGAANWFFSIFANDNLVIYLTAVALVVFVAIGMYIYYKLSIKAYYANIELEFLSTVVKISEQVDKTGKDENVPKVISQLIANDIKKDKIIKGKKPKDKK